MLSKEECVLPVVMFASASLVKRMKDDFNAPKKLMLEKILSSEKKDAP